ncbi:MAG: flavodoxin family protein [Acidimicrobiales bacterium]
MKAIVIYESLTGNTRKAAMRIGAELTSEGIATEVNSIADINLQALSEADLVVVGSWVDGLFSSVNGQAERDASPRCQTSPARRSWCSAPTP